MTKKSFSLIHNLERLSEEQRAQYLRDFSEHLGLPPDLNALDLIWMDDDNKSGLRKLVVYCRKGTADLLRDIHQVQVKSLEQLTIPGCVAFKATGVNKTDRQEIAVGAHDSEGLRGARLASAVMTAQTRACRRLTIQFAGGGMLDESEVNAQTTNINRTDASLAQLAGSSTVLPPPQVLPSVTPGKDITQSQPAIPESVSNIPQVAQIALSAQISAPIGEAASAARVADGPVLPKSISLPGPDAPENLPVAQSDSTAKLPELPPAEPPKKRRGRGPGKKRNTVDLSSPGQQIVMPLGQIDAQGIVHSVEEPAKCLDCNQPLKDHDYVYGKGYVCKISVPPATAIREGGAVGTGPLPVPPLIEPAKDFRIKTEYHVPLPPHVGLNVVVIPDPTIPPEAKIAVSVQANSAVPAQANPVSPVADIPQSQPTPTPARIDPAVMKVYNDRFRVYANDILPNGGMMPSEGMGIWAKLRRFAVVFAGTPDTTAMGSQQWEDLLGFLDDYTTKNGAAQLVAYIHKILGVQ